jgi:hypothetical protein
MALSIVNWNIAENIVWCVRLADAGTGISVELYLTQADAEGRTNLQASGESGEYGSDIEVTLDNESGASTPVSFFQDGYACHLVVSGQNGDATKIFKVKQFVDLDDIAHAIYRNSKLITARAGAEIKEHTHARITRNILLGGHLPELEPGDTARLNSTRRGLDDRSQVFEHLIRGTLNSLVSQVEAVRFLELKR